MDATENLLFLVFIMFLLSLIAGVIPLKCNAESYHMKLIATLAAGLLMGTALILIFPQAIGMLINGAGHYTELNKEEQLEDHSQDDVEDEHHEHDDHEQKELDGPKMGLAIIAGVTLMMLVHRYGPGHTHGHGHGENTESDSTTKKEEDAAVDAELVGLKDPEGEENESVITSGPATEKLRKIAAVTICLLVHAIFDGVALGIVTAGGENTALSLSVFVALMGHKAPEAISLTIILVAQGRSNCQIINNLFLLAIASPISAMLTFCILTSRTETADNAGEVLGYCMLFTGGTFIAVIFEHILPELKRLEVDRFTSLQMLIFTVGALIPLLLPVDYRL